MPLLPTMLLQAAAGGGAAVAAQDVPHPVPAPDQSTPQLTTPSRPHSPDPVAPVLEHDNSSAQPETAAGSFPSTEDAHMGANFHTSPVRSSHTPPVDHPSGGVEDPITLTALSSVISTLVQKVHSLEAELHDHKKHFKNVVGKLVKKVKSLEVKLKTKKRKMVASDSDEKDDTTPNVNLEALHALANAAVVDDSDAATDVPAATSTTPAGASTVAHGASIIAPGASGVAPGASTVAPGASGVPPGGSVAPTAALAVFADSPHVSPGASNKGKSPMIKEDIHVPARTLRQMKEDRLGEEAARQIHEEDMAKMERERAEAQRKRQQETLLGDDVSEDNFPACMAALIKKKRQALAEQLFKERQNRPLTPAQQKAYMRQPKSPEAPTPSMSEIPIPPAVASPPSPRPKPKIPTLDLDAPAQAFLKVIIDKDSYDVDSGNEVWSTMVGWEILSTPLGEINALYRIDGTTKHFTTLRQILHLVDLQDLMRLYGLVVQYYEQHPVVGSDVTYPLSVELMKKMLMEKLELDSDFVGNDLTTAKQLIQFIKNQIIAAQASSVLFWVFNSPMLNLMRIEMVINSPWICPFWESKNWLVLSKRLQGDDIIPPKD
nr:hypothetical protein [Tanacetum cinerariifolium]